MQRRDESSTYVSIRTSVLVGSLVWGLTARLTLNRKMSFSSAWMRFATAERSSINYWSFFLSEPLQLDTSNNLLDPSWLVWDARFQRCWFRYWPFLRCYFHCKLRDLVLECVEICRGKYSLFKLTFSTKTNLAYLWYSSSLLEAYCRSVW